MKFLILSQGGDGIGLALRLTAEGHDARIWIREAEAEDRGKGLVEHADHFDDEDIIIADCTGLGVLMDSCFAKTFGGSSFADKLEANREFSKEVMQRADIETPQSITPAQWDDVAEAVKKLSRGGKKVVLKPGSELSGVVPSFVASDEEDALSWLGGVRKTHGGEDVEITVQEFVDGIAVSTEGWFDGSDWVDGLFNHTIERKNLLPGDIGPSGGCTGNVVWACGSDDPIVSETLTKLTDLLRKQHYVGPFDINCVVNEEAIYGLEFTPRFGYDAFPSLLYGLFEGGFGRFIGSCFGGDGPRDFALRSGFAAGVRLSLPPWPSEEFHAKAGVAIRGISVADLKMFWPYDVRLEENRLVSTGGAGIVGVMNGVGDTIGEAFAHAYFVVSKMKVPDLQYRDDLGRVLFQDYRKLKQILNGDDDGWIGVDLDGTLAKYTRYRESVGEPIGPMVNRVKRWLAKGKEVRILTARVEPRDIQWDQMVRVHEWVKTNIGVGLEVTDRKDHEMEELWDDRVVAVEKNEGVLV